MARRIRASRLLPAACPTACLRAAAWRTAGILAMSLLASAGCQFFQAPGGSSATGDLPGTGESVEGRVRLGEAGQDGVPGPADAATSLAGTRPLTLGDDFGGIPAAGAVAINAASALSQSSGLTLLEPYRIQEVEISVFVEAVSMVSGTLLGRTLCGPDGRYKLALPANSRFQPIVLQATTLRDEAVTLYLAALLPPASDGPRARTRDISPGTTASALATAKLGGVSSQFELGTGFRGFRAGGVAALGLMADGADEVAAPALDKTMGSALTLLEAYRVAGLSKGQGLQSAFHAASTLGVKLAGATYRRISALRGGQYRVAGLSLADAAAALKLTQGQLGEVPAGSLELADFTVSSAGDLGTWTAAAADKVYPADLAAEAALKSELASERARAAAEAGVADLLGDTADVLGKADLPAASPTPAPTPTPTPIATAFLGAGANQLAKLADGRLVATTLAGGQLLALDLTPGTASSGIILAESLGNPSGVAVASDGAVFVSDQAGHVVRKVVAGAATIVAGTGEAAPASGAGPTIGDGGPATAAKLYEPTGLALGPSGDLFVVERAGGRLRKVSADGQISTIAGGGADAISEGAAATSVFLAGPFQVALGPAGEVHFNNAFTDGAVWKIDTQGKIRTVAGTITSSGAAGDDIDAVGARLPGPRSLAFDASGSLYVSCSDGIRRVDATSKKIRTVKAAAGGESYLAILVDGGAFWAAVKTGGTVEIRKLDGVLQ